MHSIERYIGRMAGKKVKRKSSKGKETKPKVQSQVTGNWLYFCPMEKNIRSIYELLKEKNQVEIWEEAGVMEVLLGEKSSLDIETVEIPPKDEVTQAFAKEQEAKTVFLLTFAPEDYELAEKVMKQILEQFGGIFCGDTEDFTPKIR